jgi:aquaporin Z
MSKAFFAELIGVFALILIGVGSIAANQASDGSLGLMGIALAHGLTIAIMVSATAAASGGHLNPAVTFGAFVAGRIEGSRALLYVLAQCLGALAGAATVKQLFPAPLMDAIHMGTPALAQGVTLGQGMLAELALTFLLVFTVFGTGLDPNGPKVGGLFIGLAVVVGILVGGPLTGAALNPARHLGPALLGGGLDQLWLYWLAPLVGGGLAALYYRRLVE